MIAVLTHHWAKKEMLEDTKLLLDRNGLAQSKTPGFVARQTLYSQLEHNKITTLVSWKSNEQYDAWKASDERVVAMEGAESLWARPPESERFNLPV